MAAYNAPWQLGASQRNQDYRAQRKPVELVGGTLDWVRAVEASSSRAAQQNATATQVSGAMGRSGIEGTAMLGATALRTQGDVAATGINARSGAYSAKTQADALVEREKAARGDSTLEYLKLAGGLGLAGLGLATM